MQLLRSINKFGAKMGVMVHLWIVFCRSVLEQSCVVWHSSLTQENNEELERCQKIFMKLVLREKYKNYEDALMKLNLDSLHSRRQLLCEKFAKSGIKHKKLDDLFPENDKKMKMETRNQEKFVVQFANTERLKKSSIVAMQSQLNNEENLIKRNCG